MQFFCLAGSGSVLPAVFCYEATLFLTLWLGRTVDSAWSFWSVPVGGSGQSFLPASWGYTGSNKETRGALPFVSKEEEAFEKNLRRRVGNEEFGYHDNKLKFSAG